MVCDHCSAELGNTVHKVNQVLALLMSRYVIKMDVLVAPLEVVDHSLISQLLLQNEDVLEEIHDSLLHVEVIKLSYHSLLVFQVLLVLVDQSIALVYLVPNVVEKVQILICLFTV